MTRWIVNVEVREGARNRGVSDEDMLHIVRRAFRSRELEENTTLMIGANAAGRLLEVVVAETDTDRARIIHAMALRPSFYRCLEGR